MGLLDVFNTDEGRMGLGLLAAAGPRSDGAGFGQRLQEGMGGFDAYKANALKQKMLEAQMQEWQQKTAQEKMALEMAQRKQAALPSLFTGGQQALAPLAGDSSIGMLPSAGRAATPGRLDVQRGLAAGYTPDELMKMDGLRNIGMDEVARTMKGMQNGREVDQQYDKFGRPVGQGVEQFKAPILNDGGGQTNVLDPYNPLKQLGSIPKTMTFGDRNAAGNLALSRQRFEFDKQGGADSVKPTFNESAGGWLYRPDKQNPSGKLVKVDGLGGGKMTEDQAKASGWLVQAENAFKNMKAATTTNPDAAKPGFNDALAAIPSLGLTTGLANMMRGPARQQYMQGASSMSEALLRAATGAGVNKDEAIQKVRELTPQIGDSDEVILQKEAAIPLYIESLKMRSGPGAARAQAIGDRAGRNIDMSDPLGLRGGGGANDPLNIMGR